MKTSPKLAVMADGVELGRGTVTIKVRPAALRVITAATSPGPESRSKKEADEVLSEPVSPLVEKTA